MKQRQASIIVPQQEPWQVETTQSKQVTLSTHKDKLVWKTTAGPLVPHGVPTWPFELSTSESHLLDHYIQRFSRTYPTFSAPTNPFLRILIPLSMQSRVVLDSLLALSAVQSWESGNFKMEHEMLKFRQRALCGCRELLKNIESKDGTLVSSNSSTTAGSDQTVHLLASCVMLLLFEKLAGEGRDNWTPHIEFFSRLFPGKILQSPGDTTKDNSEAYTSSNEALQFLFNLFLYNDLVRSTTLKEPTLSQFYLQKSVTQDLNSPEQVQAAGRFTFPCIIARIGMGKPVSDEEIAAWDGRLDWFPSFALVSPQRDLPSVKLPTSDPSLFLDPANESLASLVHCEGWDHYKLVAELYRIAATIYKRQCITQSNSQGLIPQIQTGNLPLWGVQLIVRLDEGSPLENALLWPIGIIAKELTESDEAARQLIMSRLVSLEQRFQMKHFESMQQHLLRCWATKDQGLSYHEKEPALFG